jgi:RIP metalloprotease RseP
VSDGSSSRVDSAAPDSPAQVAGLQNGDKIVAIDGQRITTGDELRSIVSSSKGEALDIVVERNGAQSEVVITPQKDQGTYKLGVYLANRIRDVSVPEAVPETFKSMGSIFTGFTNILGDRLSPSGVSTSATQSFTSATPQAGSNADLNRPRSLIGIIDTGSDIVGSNMWLLLLLLGQISFILAVFNLLPILPFDGGHAVVVLYEWIASKVKHRRVYADYRKLIPISVVLIIPILFLGLSSMVLDIRQLGQ